jgi:FtsP/CotA-like multicopper oxidase with cupredoxin domain
VSFRVVTPLVLVLVSSTFATGGSSTRRDLPEVPPPPERTLANDNRTPAGSFRDGVLTVHLEARVGEWHPDGDAAPGADLPAFAEAGKAPQIPGPLIRVVAGTTVAATVRNVLPNDTLLVYGLGTRDSATAPASDNETPVRLLPGEKQEVRFQLTTPGTYYYWATTMGRHFKYRTREDAQLNGAIVVDESGARPTDRVFLISMWSDTLGGAAPHGRKRVLAVVNGLSWPNTERLSYSVGDTAHWRVINASGDAHPMHLHGFYFRVDGRGDGATDTTFAESRRYMVVTELLTPGQTMDMTWSPERDGNWAFHCHIPEHIMARDPLGILPSVESHAHITNHALQGMSGLMLGINVRAKPGAAAAAPATGPRRRLRLVATERATTARQPLLNFALAEGSAEPTADWSVAIGPPIVITRGQPVSITVVNRSTRPTSVHWHGIELESYYDGIAGFSGSPARLSPVIAPKDSFEAQFTPPRAGTFIYHTHVDESRQQPGGLTGAIIVLEPGQRYDPATDLLAMVTSPADSTEANSVLINGRASPPPLELRVGVRYRLRIVNITVARPGMRVDVWQDSSMVQWRLLARDGADLPDAVRDVVRQARYALSIGETVDVEITPRSAAPLRLEIRAVQGSTLGTLPIRVVP